MMKKKLIYLSLLLLYSLLLVSKGTDDQPAQIIELSLAWRDFNTSYFLMHPGKYSNDPSSQSKLIPISADKTKQLKKEHLEILQTGPITEIIDLFDANSTRPERELLNTFQKKLLIQSYGMIEEKDYKACLQDGLKQYNKDSEKYQKRHPAAHLVKYTEKQLRDYMKVNYYIPELDKHFTRQPEKINHFNLEWKAFKGVYHAQTSIFHAKTYYYHCPACNTNYEKSKKMDLCPGCKKNLSKVRYHIKERTASHSSFGMPGMMGPGMMGPGMRGHSYTPPPVLPGTITPAGSISAPEIHFDHRITQPIASLLDPLADPITPIYISKDRLPLIDQHFLESIPIVLCSFRLWSTLSDQRKLELKYHAFHNNHVIVYLAPEDKILPMGTGTFIFQKQGYWENKQLQNSILEKKNIGIPTLNQGKVITEKIQTIKDHSKLFMLLFFLCGFGLPFMLCIYFKNIRLMPVFIVGASLLFTLGIFLIYYHLGKNIYSNYRTGTLLDQDQKLAYIQMKQPFFKYTRYNKSIHLTKKFDYDFERTDRDLYTYTEDAIIIRPDQVKPGKIQVFSGTKTIESNKNCHFDFENKTVINNLNQPINQILVHHKNQWYFSRAIKPGEKKTLYPVQDIERLRHSRIYKLFSSFNIMKFIFEVSQEVYLVTLEPETYGLITSRVNDLEKMDLMIGLFGGKKK